MSTYGCGVVILVGVGDVNDADVDGCGVVILVGVGDVNDADVDGCCVVILVGVGDVDDSDADGCGVVILVGVGDVDDSDADGCGVVILVGVGDVDDADVDGCGVVMLVGVGDVVILATDGVDGRMYKIEHLSLCLSSSESLYPARDSNVPFLIPAINNLYVVDVSCGKPSLIWWSTLTGPKQGEHCSIFDMGFLPADNKTSKIVILISIHVQWQNFLSLFSFPDGNYVS